VIVVGVGGEDPVVSLGSRSRHRSLGVGSNIHADTQKAKQNVGVRRFWPGLAGKGPIAKSAPEFEYLFYFLS